MCAQEVTSILASSFCSLFKTPWPRERSDNAFEWHDLPSTPRILRHALTRKLSKLWGVFLWTAVARACESLQPFVNFDVVLDLASGSGGPMPLVQKSHRLGHITLKQSDLCPDIEVARQQQIEHRMDCERCTYQFIEHSIDALKTPRSQRGTRILCTAAHHFSRAGLKKMMEDALEVGEPLLIIEPTQRKLSHVLFYSIVTPLITILIELNELRIGRKVEWTSLLLSPLVAAMVGFDGMMSCFRSYTRNEFDALYASCNNNMGFQPLSGESQADGFARFLTPSLMYWCMAPTIDWMRVIDGQNCLGAPSADQ